ncbi:MAG: hypothetical protein ACJA01_003189, partial [Saprospiraceae bacterium]
LKLTISIFCSLLYFLRIFDILINLVVYLKPNLSYCPLFWGVPMSQKSTLYPTKNVGGTTWDNPRPVVVSKGIIYCSGYKGISILDPEALQEVVASTQVRISNLLVIQQKKDTVFNKNENIPINLSYNENDIDISMTNLLLVEQSKCKYVYRLLPRDDE